MQIGFDDQEVAAAAAEGLSAYKRYSCADVASHLGLTVVAVRRLRDSEQLGCIRVGRRWFVLGGHIIRWKANSPPAEETLVNEPQPVADPATLIAA